MKDLIRITFIFLLLLLNVDQNMAQSEFSKVYYDASIHAGTVANTFDNAFVIAGIKYNAYENILIKTDSSGNLEWNKVIETSSTDIYPNIIALNDSGLLFVSNSYDEEQSYFSLLYLKINTNGDTVWVKSIDMGKSITPYSVEQTIDSGFIITGVVGDENAPEQRIAIIKLNLNGDLQWSKKMYAGNHSNYGYAVKQTPDSSFLLTGFIADLDPYKSFAYLMKLSQTGDIIWSKIYHLESSERSMGFDIKVFSDGYMLILGDSYLVHTLKTDLNGNVLWAKQYDFSSDLPSNLPSIKIEKTSDSNLIMLTPFALVKINTDGVPLWSRNLVLDVADLVIGQENGFFVVGNGPIFGVKNQDIDYPHVGVIKTDESGYNSSGCINDYGQINARDTTIISEVVSFSEANENVVAETKGLEFSTSNILVDTGCVSFIGNILENQFDYSISIYPNPSTGKINVLIDDGIQLKGLDVYDMLGTKIYQITNIKTSNLAIDLGSNQPGFYILRMKFNHIIISRKILIY